MAFCKKQSCFLSVLINFEADDWNYDVYAYNSSTALQAVLSAHVVDMGKPIEKEFFLVEKKRFLPGGF